MHEQLRRFRAMGSTCLVRVVLDDDGPSGLLDEAVALVEDLEARWSRFRPDSELSVLNANTGAPVFTSTSTAGAVAAAVESWRATGGLFDPTVHDALVASGYDRSFDDRDGPSAEGAPAGPAPDAALPVVPGPEGIEVDEAVGLVIVPEGCRLDLGGIGKGRAADLVHDRLRASGAAGACVDLGGDVRVGGATADGGDDWVIAVDDPLAPGTELARLRLAEGAVTTSSRLRRQWAGPGGPGHHLIDPTTGRPSASDLAAVTVVAGGAAWGEVHSKAALIAGTAGARDLIEGAGLCALAVADDGEVLRFGPIEGFLVIVRR